MNDALLRCDFCASGLAARQCVQGAAATICRDCVWFCLNLHDAKEQDRAAPIQTWLDANNPPRSAPPRDCPICGALIDASSHQACAHRLAAFLRESDAASLSAIWPELGPDFQSRRGSYGAVAHDARTDRADCVQDGATPPTSDLVLAATAVGDFSIALAASPAVLESNPRDYGRVLHCLVTTPDVFAALKNLGPVRS